MMNLREWMNENFFELGITPYEFCLEDGTIIDIDWDEYKNYEFVSIEIGNLDKDTKITIRGMK